MFQILQAHLRRWILECSGMWWHAVPLGLLFLLFWSSTLPSLSGSSHQRRVLDCPTLKKRVSCSFETSVTTSPRTWHHSPEVHRVSVAEMNCKNPISHRRTGYCINYSTEGVMLLWNISNYKPKDMASQPRSPPSFSSRDELQEPHISQKDRILYTL